MSNLSLPSDIIPPTKNPDENRMCYFLRVKRNISEKPADSLIVEPVELPNKLKKLRILPPEEFIDEKFNEIKLKEAISKEKKSIIFQLVKEIDENAKKAKEIKANLDEKYELFQLEPKKPNETQEKRMEQMKGKIILSEKIEESHEKFAKQKRSDLINEKRIETLKKLQNGIFHIKSTCKIEEEKQPTNENDKKYDILYCNEKPMTLEDCDNILKNQISQGKSDYAYDIYKVYVDDPYQKSILDPLNEVQFDCESKDLRKNNEPDSENDSEDSNREGRSDEDYPDEEEENSRSEGEEDFEKIASEKYNKNINSVLDKFIRKKANYAGNYDILAKNSENEYREYVDELYDEDEDYENKAYYEDKKDEKME